MKKLYAVILSLFLSCSPIFAKQDIDKTKMSQAHQKAYDAALALYGTSGDITHFLCSTTVVAKRVTMNRGSENEYLLLTAGHCITGDGLPDDLVFGVLDKIEEESPKPSLQPVHVVRVENSDKYDFAVLMLETNKEYPVIPIDLENIPKIEDKVYNINYSEGLVKQVSLGSVSSEVMTNKTASGQCNPCIGRYMVQLFDGPGSSGSAIIDEKSNKVVGIVELGFRGTLGTAAETMVSFKEWLNTPEGPVSPKVQSSLGKAEKW